MNLFDLWRVKPALESYDQRRQREANEAREAYFAKKQVEIDKRVEAAKKANDALNARRFAFADLARREIELINNATSNVNGITSTQHEIADCMAQVRLSELGLTDDAASQRTAAQARERISILEAEASKLQKQLNVSRKELAGVQKEMEKYDDLVGYNQLVMR